MDLEFVIHETNNYSRYDVGYLGMETRQCAKTKQRQSISKGGKKQVGFILFE